MFNTFMLSLKLHHFQLLQVGLVASLVAVVGILLGYPECGLANVILLVSAVNHVFAAYGADEFLRASAFIKLSFVFAVVGSVATIVIAVASLLGN